MNFNSTGGLMLLAAAALWLAVFIPGWVKRNENRQVRRVKDMSSRAELRTLQKASSPKKNSRDALRSSRLATTRRLFAALASIATASSVVLAVLALSNPMLWITFAITTTASLITMTVSMQASHKLASLLETSVKSRGETAARLSYKMRVEAVAASLEAATQFDPRAWERQPLPDQLVPIGELQLPESAPVIEISSIARPAELSSDQLDEIMRRRRSVG